MRQGIQGRESTEEGSLGALLQLSLLRSQLHHKFTTGTYSCHFGSLSLCFSHLQNGYVSVSHQPLRASVSVDMKWVVNSYTATVGSLGEEVKRAGVSIPFVGSD